PVLRLGALPPRKHREAGDQAGVSIVLEQSALHCLRVAVACIPLLTSFISLYSIITTGRVRRPIRSPVGAILVHGHEIVFLIVSVCSESGTKLPPFAVVSPPQMV